MSLRKRQNEQRTKYRRNAAGLKRTTLKRDPKPARMVAYDFETTPIEAGTPQPLYITAYANYTDGGSTLQHAEPIRDLQHLRLLLRAHFLTEGHLGYKFVAWYGNGFDAYFIAAALIADEEFVLRPYLTRGGALRGLRILRREDLNRKQAKAWEFVDGMAMLGLNGLKLEKFLANFAPAYPKMADAFDGSKERFDVKNKRHTAYAMRDSEGLWHGMIKAQQILMERFEEPLRVTMGGSCIRIFQRHIPEGVKIPTPREEIIALVRDYVMRGGYVHCVKRYKGPVWKYDLNQAYAAAMRDAQLPAGFTTHLDGAAPAGGVYIARITASKPGNAVPFYVKAEIAGKVRTAWQTDQITDTWLTSIEVAQLKKERWCVEIHESWAWGEHFSMKDYVNKLERMRMSAEGGPAGPIGTMVKMVGNHSYGKTAEEITPMETIMSIRCPEGWEPLHEADDPLPLPFVWYRWVEDEIEKAYHQPQLAAFITAHVRMVVRRAALLNPKAWLYADTDCVIFSEDMTDKLKTHPSKYGAWKVEEEGTVYKIIGKKIYTEVDSKKDPAKLKRSAKGMNAKGLTPKDFEAWFDGEPPIQHQTQRQNFLKTMQGAEMYRAQARKGTKILDTPANKK